LFVSGEDVYEEDRKNRSQGRKSTDVNLTDWTPNRDLQYRDLRFMTKGYGLFVSGEEVYEEDRLNRGQGREGADLICINPINLYFTDWTMMEFRKSFTLDIFVMLLLIPEREGLRNWNKMIRFQFRSRINFTVVLILFSSCFNYLSHNSLRIFKFKQVIYLAVVLF